MVVWLLGHTAFYRYIYKKKIIIIIKKIFVYICVCNQSTYCTCIQIILKIVLFYI